MLTLIVSLCLAGMVSLPGTDAHAREMAPYSDERRLTAEDLEGFGAMDLRIARNEIFARHGYPFQSADLAEHFNAQDWYVRNESADIALSEIELENVRFLVDFEDSHRTDPDRVGAWVHSANQTWSATGRLHFNGAAQRVDPLYGIGNTRYRLGRSDARNFSLVGGEWRQTPWAGAGWSSRQYDLDQGIQMSTGAGASVLALLRSHLVLDAVILERSIAEWHGETVTVMSIERRARIRSHPIYDSQMDWPDRERSLLVSDTEIDDLVAAGVAERSGAMLLVRPELRGEIWVSEDGLIVQAELAGHMLEFDYDHHTFRTFEAELTLEDFQRLSEPGALFNAPKPPLQDISPG